MHKYNSNELTKFQEDSLPAFTNNCADDWHSYLYADRHAKLSALQIAERKADIDNVRTLIPEKGFFADYIRYAITGTDASVLQHVGAGLAICSLILNRKIWMEHAVTLKPCLWIGLLGQSSLAKKSASLNVARRLLEKDKDYRWSVITGSFTEASLVASLGIEIKGDNVDSAREQALQEEMQAFQTGKQFTRGIGLITSDELRTHLEGCKHTYNSTLQSRLTSLYDCPSFELYKTKTSGSYYIHQPYLPILGASTVTWLAENCSSSEVEGGYFPRWMFFIGNTSDYVMPFPDKFDSTYANRALQGMEALKAITGECVLSPKAFDFYWDWQPKFAQGTENLASWCHRLTINALKVAMIYEVSSTGSLSVSLDSMQRSAKLMGVLKQQLTTLIDDLTCSKDEKKMLKVAGIIKNAGLIAHSPALRRSKLKTEEFKSIIKTLAESGRIFVVQEDTELGQQYFIYKWRG